MNELLLQLIEFTKAASPVVWAIYVKQAESMAYSYLIWATVAVAACILFAGVGNYGLRQFKKDPHSAWDCGLVIFYAFSGLSGLISLAMLLEGIRRLVNPEYYAIMLILGK